MDGFLDRSAPWFEQPDAFFQAELEKRSADAELCELAKEYRRNGFLIRDFGFDPEDLDRAAELSRSLLGKAGRVQDAWLKVGAVKRLAAHKPVLDFLSKLYDRRAFPFQTLNFALGTEQRTHSDTYHFDSTPGRFMCGVWVALEDVSPEAGPLHYYPGSHAMPVFRRSDVPGSDYADYEDFVESTLRETNYAKTVGLLRKGQALIWSANLFHGGEPRKDDSQTRLSQVTHFYFEDCVYHTPLASDPENARNFIREPYDIAEGRFVASRGENGRVYPRLDRRIRNRIRLAARIPVYS